jgi:hypothetical protein
MKTPYCPPTRRELIRLRSACFHILVNEHLFFVHQPPRWPILRLYFKLAGQQARGA